MLGSVDGTLSLLPLSRYPVTISAGHIDSRASGEFGDSDFVTDRAALSARAAFGQNLRAGLRASWTRTDRSGSGVTSSERIHLDATRTFPDDAAFLGVTSVAVSADLNRNRFVADDPADDDRDRDSARISLSVRGEPARDLFYDSLLSVSLDDLAEGGDTLRRLAVQSVSTAQWRPAARPYVVTGSLRLLSETITGEEDGAPRDSRTELASLRLGLRWPMSDHLSFNAGITAAYENVARDEAAQTGENALEEGRRIDALAFVGATYTSPERTIAGFDWLWDANAQVQNGIRAGEGFLSRESLSLGHSFRRRLDEALALPLSFTFSQRATASYTTRGEEPVDLSLSQTAGLTFQRVTRASSTSASLSLSDFRSLLGETSETQALTFRFGRGESLDRDRRLRGNVTARAIRSVDDEGSDTSVTASGSLVYEERNFVGVRDLTFRSQLRLNVLSFDDLFFDTGEEGEDSELVRNDWRNVLSYRIGLLTAELEASLFQRDEGFGYLGMLRLRRDFGGTL